MNVPHAASAALATQAGLPQPLPSPATQARHLFEKLCERKGWSSQWLDEIEDPTHDTLKDLDTMVEALHHIKTSGQHLVIAPDFDTDGITSGILGYAGLSELGFNVSLHIPTYVHGHDLTVHDIETIAARWPDTAALLTCDGGINSAEGLAAAAARGWTTLVTDHHVELEPGCAADVVVNPCRMDETYAHPGICGAHVLYQVLCAYAARYEVTKTWAIGLLRLFAGAGTVSDVMPMLYENRQLVRESLSLARLLFQRPPAKVGGAFFETDPEAIEVTEAILLQVLAAEEHHEAFTAAFTGFALMLKGYQCRGKLRDIDDLDEGFFGFYMAPSMNSPRRTGMAMDDCFALFMPGPLEERRAAMERILDNNEIRKELVKAYAASLQAAEQPWAPYVYFSEAPKGMLGLLANRLLESSGLPTVVLKLDAMRHSLSGSGRAPAWFSFHDLLNGQDAPDGLSSIGHAQACGLHVAGTHMIDELAQVMAEASAAHLLALEEAARVAATSSDPYVAGGYTGDLVLGDYPGTDARLEDLDTLVELARMIASHKPYGHAFGEPVLEIHTGLAGLSVSAIGSEAQHLRLVTPNAVTCLWWGSAEEHLERLRAMVLNAAQNPAADTGLRLRGRLSLNTFNDMTRPQIVVDEVDLVTS